MLDLRCIPFYSISYLQYSFFVFSDCNNGHFWFCSCRNFCRVNSHCWWSCILYIFFGWFSSIWLYSNVVDEHGSAIFLKPRVFSNVSFCIYCLAYALSVVSFLVKHLEINSIRDAYSVGLSFWRNSVEFWTILMQNFGLLSTVFTWHFSFLLSEFCKSVS